MRNRAMATYPKRAATRNINPDLSDRARERELRVTNHAARRIADRFGIPLHHAVAVARLAGLDPEGR
jgi:hypothetical protein